MKEIIYGVMAGIVTSLGMGGGTILIILFNFFSKLDQHIVQGINLIFFIPTAVSTIIINNKNKIIDVKTSKIVGISGVLGAVIGSIISNKINSQNLKRYFGYFLLLIAILEIHEFFKKNIKNKKEHNSINK